MELTEWALKGGRRKYGKSWEKNVEGHTEATVFLNSWQSRTQYFR